MRVVVEECRRCSHRIRLESFAAVFVRPLGSSTALETCGATRSGGSRNPVAILFESSA